MNVLSQQLLDTKFALSKTGNGLQYCIRSRVRVLRSYWRMVTSLRKLRALRSKRTLQSFQHTDLHQVVVGGVQALQAPGRKSTGCPDRSCCPPLLLEIHEHHPPMGHLRLGNCHGR